MSESKPTPCSLSSVLAFVLAAFALLVLVTNPCRAATPAEELLRLVPKDVAFCVVLQDLRGHASRLQKSPFVEQFQKSPLAKPLADSKDLNKLLYLDKFLEESLGVTSAKLLEDIFGDAVIFAYRPGPPDQPEKEQGLFLVKAGDEKTLSTLIERLNKEQLRTEDVKAIVERTYQGVTYFQRVERKGENFFWQNGPFLAVSTEESILRQAIDQDRLSKDPAEAPLIKQLRSLKADKKFLTFWINPAAFREDIKRKAEGKTAEAKALSAFFGYWEALEGIAFSVDLQEDLEITLAVRGKPDRLPESARRLFAEIGKPSELWQHIPADALFASAGRVDLMAIVDSVSEFLTQEMRDSARGKIERSINAVWDKDLLKDVLPYIGPEGCFYVAAPPSEVNDWFPHALIALQVKPGDKNAPVDQAILSGLISLAQVGIIAYNNRPESDKEGLLTLKTAKEGSMTIKFVTGSKRFPPGFQPAFALHDGYLLLASSPDVLRRFSSSQSNTQTPPKPEEGLLLKVSLKETARFLKERREPLIAFLADKNQLSKEEVAGRLDTIVSVLQVLDRVDLTQSSSAGLAQFTLHVKACKPLK